MCVISMIHDFGRTIPVQDWNRPAVDQFEILIDQAKKFDELTGQPDCVDPKKEEFFARIKHRVQAGEAADKLGLTGMEREAFVLGAEWAVSK